MAAQNIMRFHDGTSPNKSYLVNVKDATAVDPATLQITLSQPDPALLEYLTQNAGLEESPKQFTESDVKTRPIGSGPYILDTGKTVIGSKYVYTQATFNPFHTEDAKVTTLTNIIQTGSDADSATAAKQLNHYMVDQAWFVPFYRAQGNFATQKNTTVVMQSDNAYPYLWNITPKT